MNTRIGPDLREIEIEEDDEYYDDSDELACTWCGGDGMQENDDPLWHGDVYEIPCECCSGTGLRKHQTVF